MKKTLSAPDFGGGFLIELRANSEKKQIKVERKPREFLIKQARKRREFNIIQRANKEKFIIKQVVNR